MIKLIINQPGLFLTLPGIPAFRTPAEVNLTKADINLIIGELRRYGVEDYKIISEVSEVKQEIKKTEEKIQPKNKELTFEKQLNNIEKLLEKFIRRESREVIITEKQQTTFKPHNISEEEEFIPEINTTGLKVSGSISSEQGSIDDISEQVKLLKQINNGDK